MIASVAAVAGLVATMVVILQVRREREWAHGGDRLKVDVEVALAAQDTFDDVAVRLGVPAGKATRFDDVDQSVVVRVRWSSAESLDGAFELIALDGRVTPPRPLAADGGWNAHGETGSNWAGSYEQLAKRYDWLRGVGRANFTNASGIVDFPTAAVDAPAAGSGAVTAWFRQWDQDPIPFADPAREVVVALVHEDASGEVRWARRIFG